MKIGTRVRLTDGSYGMIIENGGIKSGGNLVDGCIYEVMATGMKLPTDYYPCNASSTHWNDTILRNIATDKLVFVESRFIRELSKEVPFLTAVKAYREGKTIKNVWGLTERVYSPSKSCGMCGFNLTDNHNLAINALEILEGKWYVEVPNE